MKYLTIAITILLLAAPAAAQELVQLNPAKSSYAPQETMQLRVLFGEEPTFPLTAQDIVLFDDRGGKIPLALSLTKLTDKEYYAYFDLPSSLRDNITYSVATKELKYRTADGTTAPLPSQELFFTIMERDAVLSMQPAIFFKEINPLDQPGFNLRVSNRGSSSVEVTFSSDADFITIPQTPIIIAADGFKEVAISTKVVGKPENVFSGNVIMTYDEEQSSVPVILRRVGATQEGELVVETPELPNQEEETPQPSGLTDALRFVVSITEVDLQLGGNENQTGIFPLKNDADSTLTNIQISLTGNLADVVSVTPTTLESLNPGETANLEVVLNPNNNLQGSYEGEIVVNSEQGSELRFPIKLSERTPVQVEQTIPEDVGVVPIDTTQLEEPKSKTWVTVLIIVILLLVIGLGIYFIRKQGKKGPKGNIFPFRP